MSINVARLRMLRGNLGGESRSVRPPRAIPEPDFFDICSRCDACIDACPSKIILRGSGGYPEIDFHRGECDFCGECQAHCNEGALLAEQTGSPWGNVIKIDSQRCLPAQGVMCLTCAEQCEVEAITFKPTIGGISLPQLDLDGCTGCGACIAPCPNRAITILVSDSVQQQPATGENEI